MDMKYWAENEIKIACEKEESSGEEGFEYGCTCYESALKAFNSLIEDGNSGCSIGFTQNILNRLIEGKPLTPIEDTPDMWNEVPYRKDIKTFQCRRMSSLFKDIDDEGNVSYHDNNRFYCTNIDNPRTSWHNGFVGKLIHEMYPITMPYLPSSKPYIVYCSDSLYDPKNGDFDTMAIWYVKKPDGEKETIERFFKEGEHSWAEISKEEYEERVGNK